MTNPEPADSSSFTAFTVFLGLPVSVKITGRPWGLRGGGALGWTFDQAQLAITDNVMVPGTTNIVQQLLSEEPGGDKLGPFKATDANTRTTKTRGISYFPFEVLAPLLGADLTARHTFELVVTSLIDAGLEDVCLGLIISLTVTLVQPTEDRKAPITVKNQLGKSGHLPGPLSIHYKREHLLYRDLPLLRPVLTRPTTSDPALAEVSRGMRDMVAEARTEHKDRADNHEEARHLNNVREKMGDTLTDHLLIIFHATCDEEPPRI
jgi:hypothetical protein